MIGGQVAGMRMWSNQSGSSGVWPMAGFVLLCLLAGLLGFTFIHTSTRQLLEAEARLDAEQWSRDLLQNVDDLKRIAAGNAPAAATVSYLEHARRTGQVFSFRVYNAGGLLRLRSVSPGRRMPLDQPIEYIDREFAGAMRKSTSMTIIQRAGAIGEPEYYASAMVPIMDEFRIAGWLVADIDQSGRQALFQSVTTRASIAIGLLLIAAPILGFWYRARQNALFEKTIESLARHDQLTGLINKATFLENTEAKMAIPLPGGHQYNLVLFKVGGTTVTAQTHGQEAGDHLIRTAAERLCREAGGIGDVASAGRNVLALLIGGAADPMQILSLVKELTGKLAEPVDWRGRALAPRIHAGIALSSTDGKTAAGLMRSAELALHSAHEQGTPGYGFFNPEIAKDTQRRSAVQRAVSEAAAAHTFRLDFQPVYDFRSGELNGFEALLRLEDPELGSISPGEFVPVAEQMGLINTIGGWCLLEACRTAAEWPPHLMVAVNLSPFQFFTGTLISDVRQALTQSAFPSYRLEVEITEGTLLNDSELVLSQLRVLRDMGVAVALDDFGTGYSSLGYLWKFPFSKLKIDRSFVWALDESQSARGILRSIIKLGHSLGLAVTAEGIENNKQFNTLRDLGCDLAQGFLLDRPARTADLAAIILRNFANGLKRRAREVQSGKSAA